MNWKQFVEIENVRSEQKEINAGVAQGSKLSASLFLIYINRILKLPLKSKAQFYADDGLLIFEANSFNDLEAKMLHDLELVHNWLDQYQLKMDIKQNANN